MKDSLNVTHSKGRLAFTTRRSGEWPWQRDLDLDGQPLYHIGNTCDTCMALFEKSSDASCSLAPEELARQLRQGIQTINQPLIDTISQVLPDGGYRVSLLPISPAYLPPGKPAEWEGLSSCWAHTTQIRPALSIMEYLLPATALADLNEMTIKSYETEIGKGLRPTALALSVLDVRYLRSQFIDWKLVHFLLDGHHKIMAASRLNAPISLLSFFALDESFAPRHEIDQILQARYAARKRLF